MKPWFIVPVALFTMSGFALAQSQPPATLSRTVPTGKIRQVGFFAVINPDCSSAGDADARRIKQPNNCTAAFDPGTGFNVFTQKSPYFVCNSKQTQGIRIKYTSKDGYIGKDEFEVEFLTPTGGDITWKFAVTVK